MVNRYKIITLAMFIVVLIGCDRKEPIATVQSEPKGETKMKIESTAFQAGKPISRRYSGEGDDISPPLSWSDLPNGTKQLALVCDDPDAPSPEPWVHWVIYNISADVAGLGKAVKRQAAPLVPAGAVQGKNSWPSNNIGYRGPMPPPGHGIHHYYFKLYALDGELDLTSGLDKKELLAAIKGHVLAEAELVGTYQR